MQTAYDLGGGSGPREMGRDADRVLGLKSLDDEGLTFLLKALEARARGLGEVPVAWTQFTTILIPKVLDAATYKHLRPTALLEVLYKVLVKLLILKMQKDVGALGFSEFSFGFRPGFQCAEVYQSLLNLVLRSVQWKEGLVVCRMDLAKAYV